MNRGIYSLATGMLASQQQMDVVSNNLANVSTSGFKADQILFNDALQRQMNSKGQQIGNLGSGAMPKKQYTDLRQGTVENTENPTDLALEGNAMFAFQQPNGTVAYSRNGSLLRQTDGTLTDKQGNPILDANQNPIVTRPGQMQIDSDGSISTGDGSPAYAKIGLFQGTMAKNGFGNYSSADAVNATALGQTNRIKQGALETSNVNAVGSMVDMITLNRSFELAQKSIQSEDSMTQTLTTVLS